MNVKFITGLITEKGIFEKEIDKAVAEREVDFAGLIPKADSLADNLIIFFNS